MIVAALPRLSTLDQADAADRLADRVGRLTLMHTNPEAFFVERSDVRHELRKLARSLRGER